MPWHPLNCFECLCLALEMRKLSIDLKNPLLVYHSYYFYELDRFRSGWYNFISFLGGKNVSMVATLFGSSWLVNLDYFIAQVITAFYYNSHEAKSEPVIVVATAR